ncbi:(1-_4)-alpha-D-glucan 1-alpha-D-glucosylmutase [Palleronia aestuarii]|uniref:(1->4)-alpha-D-glucan 1-alpha-D-glucosylmutase n=1 Tax=Palleronia aestuarii TaxID=568105 RepID=A0A2W7N7S5_9RHOB|nr:malto-oligosyltrehalose synthase [Palleronia aestuarii]PZX12924.1 (1->4)-alpha-D-glucan 1-alpha-D-glucosylmutase [Palleronia aestuarii]
MKPFVATYRLQLRGDVDFDAAASYLPLLGAYGISHLYLSPIFTAATGSTHGYDITDPSEIDPVLGGEEGFTRLSRRAGEAGIGLVIDMVPNHTAFSVENPWLRDVLRHGPASRYAKHFDIDWAAGPLIIPTLGETFEDMVAAGEIRVEDDAMIAHDKAYPLRPDGPETDDLETLHAAQHWRLVHWHHGRDSVTHRRFFNVTDLIGMRVEDPDVFDDMDALPIRLSKDGLVDGLRLDHIDGLADPTEYLERLRKRLPDTPIWVEKILTGDETLPDWPVEGTTGYEAGRRIAMLLTDPEGHARLVEQWQEVAGIDSDFEGALEWAKGEVMTDELAAELHQLIALAGEVVPDAGAETRREAVMALLRAFPRYRTYITDDHVSGADAALMRKVADHAAEWVRVRDTVDALTDAIVTPGEAPTFTVRFQQVTGALLAKAHEDTAGFRWNAYLAANEVGADPAEVSTDAAGFTAWCADRTPLALTLTSSHDTKRSEDARMRLVAISRCPDAFAALWKAAPPSDAVTPNRRWYLLQSALAIWDPEDSDLEQRLRDHTMKAMREAKTTSNWTQPDEDAEEAAGDWVAGLVAGWRKAEPEALRELVEVGARLSLVQLALKVMMPGVPDFYQGCLGRDLSLTDPDNRRPVDPDTQRALLDRTDLHGDKARLSRDLIALRREDPAFFEHAAFAVEGTRDMLRLTRTGDRRTIAVEADLGDADGTKRVRIVEGG